LKGERPNGRVLRRYHLNGFQGSAFSDAAKVADDLVHHGLEHLGFLADMALLVQGGRGSFEGLLPGGQQTAQILSSGAPVCQVAPEDV
jgi:hypothetical protein